VAKKKPNYEERDTPTNQSNASQKNRSHNNIPETKKETSPRHMPFQRKEEIKTQSNTLNHKLQL
jgi:hypothetical protein